MQAVVKQLHEKRKSPPPELHDHSITLKADKVKSFDKIMDEKEKEEDKKQASNEKEATKDKEKAKLDSKLSSGNAASQQLDPFHHFLYELMYHDPSTWSMADKAHYQPGKEQIDFKEFNQMLAKRQLKLQDFSTERLVRLASLTTRRQFSAFLDQIMREKAAMASQGAAPKLQNFLEAKTSLQQIAKNNKVSENEVIKDLLKQISLRNIKRGTEVKIVLNPKALGEVSLRVVLQGKELKAQFNTKSHVAASILDANMDALRQALSSQGLTVEKLEIESIA